MSNAAGQHGDDSLDVAVIGMAGRFPGAPDISSYWRNLCNGVEAIQNISEEELIKGGADRELIERPDYVRRSSQLAGIELFDADFFGFSPKEAASTDPQARIFLECAWHAMEDAGLDPERCNKSVGVYAASSLNTYFLRNVHQHLDMKDFILSGSNLPYVLGNGQDFLATRVSYKLNLAGPSIDIQTACSSALVAIHTARQALLNGECDMALAGAVSVYLPQDAGYLYQDGLILSPDGRCRAFDEQANGTVFGRGAGIVVLKPLGDAVADGDNILAVIKGSAVNNDGARKVGYAAPSDDGQSDVVTEAIVNADVDAESISYVETHGTGTLQGDPIEISALTRAFAATSNGSVVRPGRCAIGSVKPNIGHLDAASGVASFIKVVLMLNHKRIPPSINYKKANAEIDFDNGPFFVNTELRNWADTKMPRRAGISAFGIGGTNAHMVLEETSVKASRTVSPGAQIFLLSTKREAALQQSARQHAEHLEKAPPDSLTDICYTAAIGRSQFRHRLAVVGNSADDIGEALSAYANTANPWGSSDSQASVFAASDSSLEPESLVFMFTGQGSQYSGMGRKLYEEQPLFRSELDACDSALQPHLDGSIRSLLFGVDDKESMLNQTQYAQPALFVLEYCLARFWQSLGIKPAAMIGHSLGEYVAACLSGVFSLEDALKIVTFRARLMQLIPPGGSMAAALSDMETIQSIVQEIADDNKVGHGNLVIAAVNGPRNIVVSGSTELVDAFSRACSESEIQIRRLAVSHAFHSPLMEPVLGEFAELLGKIEFRQPELPVISNVTGSLADATSIATAEYWVEHARHPVLFADGLRTLAERHCTTFLEIGPHPVLTGLGCLVLDSPDLRWVASLHREIPDSRQIAESAAQLFVGGADLDWHQYFSNVEASRVSLPGYPFEKQRHWLEPPAFGNSRNTVSPGQVQCHPFLDFSVSTPTSHIYQSEIDPGRIKYLADHRVADAVIFPATGFVELALAAAHVTDPDGQWSVANLQIRDALELNDSVPVVLQVILDKQGSPQKGFEVHSQREGKLNEWTLHATGAVTLLRSSTGYENPDVAAVKARCQEEKSGESFYRGLQLLGFEYGAAFRGIERLWYRDGEALARIECPEAIVDARTHYSLHPALLDACLQSVFAAIPDEWQRADDQKLFIPTGVDSIQVLDNLTTRMWAHVRIRATSDCRPTSFLSDILVTSDAGKVLVEVSGIQLQRATLNLQGRERKELRDYLYQIDWRVDNTRNLDNRDAAWLPQPETICENLLPKIPLLREKYRMDILDRLSPQLDYLSFLYVDSALRDLGWNSKAPQGMSIAKRADYLGVAASHNRMLARMFEIFEEGTSTCGDDCPAEVSSVASRSDPAQLIKPLMKEFPECNAMLSMLDKCGQELASVLTGKTDPLQLLFEGGSLKEIEAIYKESPFTFVYNSLVRSAVEFALTRLPKGRRLKVIEIGAGTGGTTEHLLSSLPKERTDYVYTDVSTLFLAQAADKFSDFSFVDYKILDIGADPLHQGFELHSADIVVASNVVHATPELRQTMRNVQSLLAPEGLLILVEGVAKQRWVDLIFGLTEGWWLFTDEDIRPSYPLISQRDWKDVLHSSGFQSVSTLPGIGRAQDLFQQAVILARGPDSHEITKIESRILPVKKETSYLVFADEDGLAAELAIRLEVNASKVFTVRAGTKYEECDSQNFTVRPNCVDDFLLVVERFRKSANGPTSVIFLWALDFPAGNVVCAKGLGEIQERLLAGTLHLVQSLLSEQWEQFPRLWLVTRGAQATRTNASLAIYQAFLVGMGRVISAEHPELRSACVDLDPFHDLDELNQLYAEIKSKHTEEEVAYRRGDRMVPRLVPSGPEGWSNIGRSLGYQPFNLTPASSHNLDDLQFDVTSRVAPATGEVEIRICASGVNFKDVLSAMGMYPGELELLGGECAGYIVAVGNDVTEFAVGDQVLAFSPGSLAAFLTVDARNVARKPKNISMEQAATLPGAFLTAKYSLDTLAHLRDREQVLVHAGTGGVGMAAIQIARDAGAEIFATAGSIQKRALLESLGVQHVMSSRTTEFAEVVRQVTDGRGVDVVLNCLAGEFADASLECIAAGGRFVELGKRDIRTDEEIADLGRQIEYFTVDIAATARRDPKLIGGLLRDVCKNIGAQHSMPLPLRVFPIEDTAAAFRFMAKAKHVGKLCVTQRHVPVDESAAMTQRIYSDCTYLITGGLGGLGLATARWLVDHGARYLMLMGRSVPTETAREKIVELQQLGVKVCTFNGDVASEQTVSDVLAEIDESMPPLRGVVHAAGSLADGMLVQQTWSRFRQVLGAKVSGSWNLHHLTKNIKLDFFVLYSSVASLVGAKGQANHVAANSFMDSLAHWRRAHGLPAISINWGAWADIGAVADEDIASRLSQRGMRTITPAQGVLLLEEALNRNLPQIAAVSADWHTFLQQFDSMSHGNLFSELAIQASSQQHGATVSGTATDARQRIDSAPPARRRAELLRIVTDEIKAGLGIDTERTIGPQDSLADIGLDSLMAVELRHRLVGSLALEQGLPVTLLFDYPTTGKLTDYLAREVFQLPADEPNHLQKSHQGIDVGHEHSDIEQLSDEEAEAMLLTELDLVSGGK